MQSDLFKAPAEVTAPRPQNIQDMFGLTRQVWLEDCRAAAKQLLQTRESVTVEDVLLLQPRPEFIHRNATGSIFSNGEFKSVGWTQSKRPQSKGRYIMQWRLK